MNDQVNLWEWRAELDTIYDLTGGPARAGHRIRYRRQGGRRWSSFLLTTDDGRTPTETMVTEAIEAHAAMHSDDHSASRRVDVLEREAPHLLARPELLEADERDAC